MIQSKGPVLVVASHPDDEVLGCGGTMARLADEGREIHVVILGEGVTSRFTPGEADQAEVERLLNDIKNCCTRAAGVLGARSPVFCDLRDNRFDSYDLLDIVKKVEEIVEDVRPETVLVQHGGDLNVDHALTFRAVLTAVRPMQGRPVRELNTFEAASSTEWAFGRFAPKFEPNLFIDISNSLERKIKAMNEYEAESRPFPHPRSPDAIRANAVHWGSVVGAKAAEAFQTVFRVG